MLEMGDEYIGKGYYSGGKHWIPRYGILIVPPSAPHLIRLRKYPGESAVGRQQQDVAALLPESSHPPVVCTRYISAQEQKSSGGGDYGILGPGNVVRRWEIPAKPSHYVTGIFQSDITVSETPT
ncbi:hypothetical protein Tco_1448982 [Tanacetum coccineum]